MVNLTRIYTRTGDAGRTKLSDLSETSKTDPRVEAYGDVDEANSLIGLIVAQPDLPEDIRAVLAEIQNVLFDCGADLSNPLVPNPPYEPLRIVAANVEQLEAWCDHFGDPLPALRSFILPGGSQSVALLHLARSVTRRAERSGWRAAELYGTEAGDPGGINLLALNYLNRLSDLLFILARAATPQGREILWIPGKEREVTDPKGLRQRARIQAAGQTGSAE